MTRRRMQRRLLSEPDDINPMNQVGNLFDVAMVFSVALMVALVSYLDVSDMLFSDNFTLVKNPGQPDMQIITKEAGSIVRYRADANAKGDSPQGKRIGTAFQLENGEIIYVPDT